MAVNPSHFYQSNIIDTCSIWNVLSSKTLYNASQSAKCVFSCTYFVIYECLYKSRKTLEKNDTILIKRLKEERKQNKFIDYHIDIQDLQEIEILENRKKLSKGELSSLVFAKKTQQAFLTDDQSARILAEQIIDSSKVQTTPHLFGWLYYSNYLSDSDKKRVINEHRQVDRPLTKYFEDMYLKACELKLSHRFT